MEATERDVTEKKDGLTRKGQKERRNCKNKETQKVEAAKKTFHLKKGNDLNNAKMLTLIKLRGVIIGENRSFKTKNKTQTVILGFVLLA